MNLENLRYIKNVNPDLISKETDTQKETNVHKWAYEIYPINAYFQLNFKQGEKTEAHAEQLRKGDLILLSQRPAYGTEQRSLTHIVELVNHGHEDKTQWNQGTWGIFRWCKVHWVVDFNNADSLPCDHEVLGSVDWGWQNTLAKGLDGNNLKNEFGNIDNLREHLKQKLGV